VVVASADRKVGIARASLLVFATGPVAVVALPSLRHAGLIADTPIPVLVAVILACTVVNGVAIATEPHLTPNRALHLRTAVAAISTMWVVYAAGWGPLLTIAYAIGIADAMRVHGSHAWRPGLAWSAFAIGLGEIAVTLHWAPTILKPAVEHTVAGVSFVLLGLIARTLGSAANAAERATAQVEEGRAYFRDLVQHSADVIALVNANLEIDYISPGIEALVGREPTTCLGLHIGDVLGAEAGEDIVRAYDTLTLSDYLSCEWHLTNDLGEQRSTYARLTRRENGSLVLNLRDVTEQRALEAQLLRRANVDALTGLPNRSSLTNELQAFATLHEVTVLFIDLDGFKEVNDSLGHERGDAVLRDVARAIAGCMPAGVTVGRLGGDEFLAIAPGRRSDESLELARDIIATIEDIGNTVTRFPLSASVGVATGVAEDTPEQLLHRADQAMYKAKAVGPGKTQLARPPHPAPIPG
jgi:diguanylate cyclase (GGDEF)-like protein